MLDAKTLSKSLAYGAKEANAFTQPEALLVSVKLQEIVGDPDTQPTSWNSQFQPSTGSTLMPNPLSPVEGDSVFFNGLFAGARFMSHDGQYWTITDYQFEGAVTIQNDWYPRLQAVVSIQDIRRSIHSWTDPFLQRVPPPPAGVDYGVIETREVK